MKKSVIKRLAKAHEALEPILSDLTDLCENVSLPDDDHSAIGDVLMYVEQAINQIREIAPEAVEAE